MEFKPTSKIRWSTTPTRLPDVYLVATGERYQHVVDMSDKVNMYLITAIEKEERRPQYIRIYPQTVRDAVDRKYGKIVHVIIPFRTNTVLGSNVMKYYILRNK